MTSLMRFMVAHLCIILFQQVLHIFVHILLKEWSTFSNRSFCYKPILL